MMLSRKIAVIFGGGGAIGGSVARRFADEGAEVFLAGRSHDRLREVAHSIEAGGGVVHTAQVDALDEQAVGAYVDDVVESAGGIDISLNAVGVSHVQGTPLETLSLTDFMHPISTYLRTNFVTARAVAHHMRTRGRGVILTLTTPGSKLAGTGFLGYGTTCGAVETFSRVLSGEVGPDGVRVVCLRANALPDSVGTSHLGEVFAKAAQAGGATVDQWFGLLAQQSVLRRLPTLDDIANVAAFAASDHAGAMTGAILNLTCGHVVD